MLDGAERMRYRGPMDRAAAAKTPAMGLFLGMLLLLAWDLGWGLPSLRAEGLRLFSYTDDQGRFFVVDRLDKVPPEFRKSVRESLVRPFRPAPRPPAPEGRREFGTGKAPVASEKAPTDDLLSVESPPPETKLATEPAWASASLWLGELDGLQGRGERIWRMAKVISPAQRQIRVWHWEALRVLERLRDSTAFAWDRGKDWCDLARVLTEQYRSLFYTVTKWLDEGGERLDQELPPLLNRTRFLLERLRRELPPPLMLDLENPVSGGKDRGSPANPDPGRDPR